MQLQCAHSSLQMRGRIRSTLRASILSSSKTLVECNEAENGEPDLVNRCENWGPVPGFGVELHHGKAVW